MRVICAWNAPQLVSYKTPPTSYLRLVSILEKARGNGGHCCFALLYILVETNSLF